MAYGIKKLRACQIGAETTAGTAVPATVIWRGPGAGVQALDDIVFVEEDIANLGGANRTIKLSSGAQLALPETVLTFEQFCYLLEMGVETATPAADGAGTGYVYTYDFPLTSANTIKTYTVEAGDNQKAHEMEYSFCPEFTVSGNAAEGVMMRGTLRGRQRTVTTFTASLSAPSVSGAAFQLSTLYIDAVSGSMGGTQASSIFLGFTLSVNTGLVPVYTGDGQLYFTLDSQVGWEITADVAFRHIDVANTEEAAWLAQTARLLEIKLEGPDLTTAGTYSKKTVRFQLPGKWQSFTALEDKDGNDILTGTFKSVRDPTAALGPIIVVVNELETLP